MNVCLFLTDNVEGQILVDTVLDGKKLQVKDCYKLVSCVSILVLKNISPTGVKKVTI
jgi:hypothetical protein